MGRTEDKTETEDDSCESRTGLIMAARNRSAWHGLRCLVIKETLPQQLRKGVQIFQDFFLCELSLKMEKKEGWGTYQLRDIAARLDPSRPGDKKVP